MRLEVIFQERYVRWPLLAALFLLTAGFSTGCATAGLGSQHEVIRAKDRVAPALVHIRPVKEVYSGGKREEVVFVGSGFIISSEGYVLTNEHVAGESKFVRCVLGDKEEVEAQVVGVDAATDIAVLKLKVDHPLPHVRLGDSDRLQAGQTVLALGSPHGLARSVSLGIVSVTDRYLDEQGVRSSPYNSWIQTDAAINRGNSGGPLVNLRGEVVGVNARMLSGAENIGFAIPINEAKQVAEQLIAHGRVQRSWLGLSLQEMLAKTDDPVQKGVVIADVDPLSPAHEAGIHPGDLLVAINGRETNARFPEDLPAIRKRIAELPVGQAAVLSVMRGEEKLNIPVTTEERNDAAGTQREFAEWGFTAADLSPEIVRRAQLAARQGILITGAQVGGIASDAGLLQGDILLKIDDEEVTDLAAFSRLYEERVAAKTRLVLLVVKRGALTRFVLVQQSRSESGSPALGGSERVE